jgi:hypothetical protein
MMKLRFFLLFVFVLMVISYGPIPAQADGIYAQDVILTGWDFAGGEIWQVAVTDEGLQLDDAAAYGSYTSPILTAPLPFNAIVPQWRANLPAHTQMTMRLRTANADGLWNDWYDIVPNEDWMRPEDTDTVGNMVVAPDTDGTHHFFQYTVSFSRLTAEVVPALSELRFTFIDSTAGPTSEELAAIARAEAQANPHNPENGYAKPPVVSRATWCTDPACNYTAGLEYEPVTHLIVHHTVSSNTSTNWAAVVRAIWHFHTFTRAWGDIGYNYLVDMNGVLYEGHNGGDDVIGTHASGANAGSMALSFIGTFTLPTQSPPGITPPPAMLDAAVELFSWKADQKEIDVYDSSQLPNMGWGLPHLMGHRDAYGTTACPGEQAHDLVPWIRDMVASRIGFTPPHTYIDELSGAFTKSNNTFTEGPNSCGYNVHAWYARSTTGTATHWGRWQMNVVQPGWYEVEVYAPYCNTGFADTHGAKYEVHHNNGVTNVVVDQGDNLGLWVSLGEFYLEPGDDNHVYLTNKTTTDSNLGLWYDAIRLRPQTVLPPTVTIQQPPAHAWLTNPLVNFGWEATNQVNIQSLTLEVATDAAFTNLVFAQPLNAQTTATAYIFTEDYRNLYWRVTAYPLSGGAVTSTTGHFGLDTAAPTSSVNAVYILAPTQPVTVTNYLIHWLGDDATSGIASYTVDYRPDGAATWTRWLTDTTSTANNFAPPEPGTVYWFRVQATDVAGNHEITHPDGDINTTQAILLDNRMMLPIIQR